MIKTKFILVGLGLLLSATSCGIFKKDCGCPHFGKIKAPAKTNQAPVVYAAR
ncbi:hypothetical protein ACFS5N_10240 [Mucilaginibacter ximonensis]|uniref:Lipoprotein n=1 Tax=Mucilaginibacter ximonensis TaxID=538021 RepID=A0ABW5YBX0_9SPHI